MKTKKKSDVNLLFGSSSSIGLDFVKLFKDENFIFFSRSKINVKFVDFDYLNLDNKITKVPKNVNKIFFLQALIILKNLKTNIFVKEKKMVKKNM